MLTMQIFDRNPSESMRKELAMFRSIDWIKLGTYFDREINLDLTGWEFMSNAIDKNDISGVIRYIQMRFNTEHHYNSLFDRVVENEHREIIDVLSGAVWFSKEFDAQEDKIKSLKKEWERDHLLTCLAEECGEVMEAMFLEPDNKEKIEYELNDIIGVTHLLHDEDIVCANLDKPRVSVSGVSNKDIYTCVKDIQHFTHKSIRFGLLNSKPNSNRRNLDELTTLLQKLVLLIYSSKEYNLYENFDAKKEKVLKFMKSTSVGKKV